MITMVTDRPVGAAEISKQNRKPYFSALGGWRFWAAAVVLVHHINRFPYFVQDVKGPSTFTLHTAAMAFFFILSGFFAAASVEKEKMDHVTIVNYYTRRVIRIWPQHFLVLLLFAFLPFKFSAFTAGTFAANFFLIQSWFPWAEYYFSYNAPAWYLSTLLGLYFMVPLFVRYFKTSICLSVLLPFLLSLMVPQNIQISNFYYVLPFSNAFKFLFGMAVYRFVSSILQKHQGRTQTRSGFFLWSVLEIAITALVFFFSAQCIYPLTVTLPKYLNLIFSIWLIRNVIILLPLFFFLVIFSMERGLISRLLSTGVAGVLGQISFIMYIWHFLIRDIILRYDLFHHIPLQWRLLSFVLVVVVLSLPLEYGLNKPITRFLNSLLKKHPLKLNFIRQYGALLLAICFTILYLGWIIPWPLNYTTYVVKSMRPVCDNVIKGQIKLYPDNAVRLHPGRKPTSVIFPLNQCVDTFSCKVEPAHAKTDVIVKFYLDNILVKVIHAAGKGNNHAVSLACSGARQLRIEVDKNGNMSYDTTMLKGMKFTGY